MTPLQGLLYRNSSRKGFANSVPDSFAENFAGPHLLWFGLPEVLLIIVQVKNHTCPRGKRDRWHIECAVWQRVVQFGPGHALTVFQALYLEDRFSYSGDTESFRARGVQTTLLPWPQMLYMPLVPGRGSKCPSQFFSTSCGGVSNPVCEHWPISRHLHPHKLFFRSPRARDWHMLGVNPQCLNYETKPVLFQPILANFEPILGHFWHCLIAISLPILPISSNLRPFGYISHQERQNSLTKLRLENCDKIHA